MAEAARPRVALTLGDPAGIGPEVVRKALAEPAVRDLADMALYVGPRAAWAALAGGDCPEAAPMAPNAAPRGLGLVEVPGLSLAGIEVGRPSAASGRAAVRSIRAAIDAARAGRVDAIVTAPISKQAVKLAGHPWPGHTELLAEKLEAGEVAMLFAGGPFRVVLATIHVSLLEAIHSLTTEGILRVMRLADRALKERFGLERPRLGVCGLNPHAGEAGRFGHEEREIIAPAVEQAGAEGMAAFGPLPPDTAFRQAMQGRYDCMVAMYHDQGLIPIKTVAFEDSVNVTLGLPVVRTSPDHGTAFDIAGRGQADPHSMRAALRLAVEMVRHGRPGA